MKQSEGNDFSIHFNEAGWADQSELLLKCKKCTWKIDLNKLDTLLDISDEIEHHDEMCQTWSNHEVSSTR